MKRNKTTIDTFQGAHKDETIIVMGNSKSLNRISTDIFDGYTTVGVNRLLRTYEPIYLLVVDKSVLQDEYQNMLDHPDVTYVLFPGLMGSKQMQLYDGPWISAPMKKTLDPTAKSGYVDTGHVGNSGYEATQIAYRMGAKRILLAGIDMYWPHKGDTHSFGDGHKFGCKLRKPEEITKDFGEMKRLYAHGGVELASISPWDTPFRRVMGYVNPATLF